ncbi:MAG TPA: methionine--tRNA ligase subunit beta, partial [Bacteroidota bacterium]|nr:methionine--tRNA ligase subunit beta [Bacteroidota bacterium]
AEPWKFIKTDRAAAAATIAVCLRLARALAIYVEPVLPSTAARIWNILRLPGKVTDAGWESAFAGSIPGGHGLGKPEILFTKIEDSVIQDILSKLPAAAPPAAPAVIAEAGIGDFKKINFRVARIVSAEKVAKSEKLLKITVSLGSEERQVIAGIAKHYEPESLIGKKVIIIANLRPAKLMGLESRGMILAASDDAGNLTLLTLDGDIAEGSIVK